MSVRRRRIKERVERDRIRSESSARASHSLECMRRAIDDAIARGAKIVTPRTTRDMRRHLMAVRTAGNGSEVTHE